MPEKRKSAAAFSCRAFYLCRRDDSPCTLWLAKALEMDNLALAQEADHIIDVRIVGQTEDVVISEAGFLLCRQVLSKIGDDVPGDLHGGGGPGISRGKLGIYSSGVIHKIGVEPRGFNLFLTQVTGKLVNQGSYHLQVPQFLSTYQGGKKYQQKIT